MQTIQRQANKSKLSKGLQIQMLNAIVTLSFLYLFSQLRYSSLAVCLASTCSGTKKKMAKGYAFSIFAILKQHYFKQGDKAHLCLNGHSPLGTAVVSG